VPADPIVPEEVTGQELDRSVWQQLRTLSKENAREVARHLVMVSAYLEADELDAARAHAVAAVRRAARVAAAREAHGLVAYRQGDYARALGEFRTVRRLSGSEHVVPYMVDCERGLGRHERALELAAAVDGAALTDAERVELAIVVAGIRRDLGDDDAALLELTSVRAKGGANTDAHRLYYAYAETLVALGRVDEAKVYFRRVVASDVDGGTDAVERLEELEGIRVTEMVDGDVHADRRGVS
jgi:tetratricopeptide (TPR) repeat protein